MTIKYKFEIGEKVYPAGCSRGYQEANPFTVRDRKISRHVITIDGQPATIKSKVYSDETNGRGWFLESDLTRNLDDY